MDTKLQKLVLVGIRCPEEVYKRIRSEALVRGLTLQRLVTEALNSYFAKKPSPTHREIVGSQERLWKDLFQMYVREMPQVKLDLLMDYLELNLRLHKSSRLRKLKKGKGE